MTPELFLQLSDPLPEPTFLVTGSGTVLAANRATEQRLGVVPRAICGRPLADVVSEPADRVVHYLRACSRSRDTVLGALTVAGSHPRECRAEGAVVRPREDDADALVLLRLVPKESATGKFVALNLRIEEQGKEIHRRKEAEDALRRQEEWLRVTLSSIGDAVIATDAEGRVTFMNPVAESLTGWVRAEALGRPLPEVFRIVNEYTREPAENPALRSLREGRVVGLANHTVLIARDGTERPIDDSASPLRDAGVTGAVLVFRDVTERWRAERERARLAAIVESSEDAIVSKTLDGVIQTWNAGAERIFGYAAAEAVGKSITLIIPPERLDEERDILAKLRRGERVEHFETVRVAKGGRRVDISLTVSPIRDRDGHVIGASKVARDVTDRRRIEAAVRASEERLRRMVNVDGVGVLLWVLPEGRLVGSNDYFLRMFGYAREEVEAGALTWRDLTPPEYVAVSEEQLVGFAVTGRIGPYEKEYYRKDGSRAWMVFAGASLGDGAVVEYCIDVSDRKRAEAALREADRKKDDFIALLAHELRNPLAPIRNGLQVLRMSEDRAARERSQRMMDRQLSHMVRIIDDLLDVSRINRNKMELRRARVPLAEVVSSAVETAGPAIEEAGHELTVSLPGAPVFLDADLTRLAQVLGNLLTNSAKYTPKGGRVWLSAERKGPEVVVSVRDTGIGIPGQSLSTIFDMFSQVNRTIERSTGGLGIGLALVRGLVEMHGGTVTAASGGPGQGSTFTVTLPVATNRAEPTREIQEGAKEARAGRRVLVVDDNRDGAESMAEMLVLMGDEVRIAHDGEEAVAAAEAFRPEVILMDVGMPKLNGLDATRRIRERPWGRAITIVALTGWGKENDREQSRGAGCDGHLVKPVDLADLEKLLAEVRPRG